MSIPPKARLGLYTLLIISVILLGAAISHWGHGQATVWAQHILSEFEHLTQAHPALYILTLALLPLVGMPVTPLYVLGGLLYGFPFAFYLGAPALLLNLLIVFGLCQRYLRPWLLYLIQKTGHKLWQINAQETWRITLLVRATPGPPIFLQSYLLALAGVPLKPFLMISWPIECVHLTVFSLSASSAGEGHYGEAIIGLSLIVLVALVPHFIKKCYDRNKQHMGSNT